MTDRIEVRGGAAECRALSGNILEGYAATYGAVAALPGYSETIAPGAFAESLRTNPDILALLDHNKLAVIARTRNGSLALTDDSHGLHFRMQVADTTAGRDAYEIVRSGLAGGMSFAFRVRKGGESWPSRDRRELRAVELIEISIVSSFPAYPDTTVAARSRDAAEGARQWLIRQRYLESL